MIPSKIRLINRKEPPVWVALTLEISFSGIKESSTKGEGFFMAEKEGFVYILPLAKINVPMRQAASGNAHPRCI